MRLKTLFVLLSLVVIIEAKVNSVDYYVKFLYNMTETQQNTFLFIWYNAKRVNLPYTLTAISILESNLGSKKLNLSDPSCGLFHKLVTQYAIEKGLKPNLWNASRLCEKLLESDALAYKVAESDFKKLYKYWFNKTRSSKLSWKYAIMTYNAGYRWRKDKKVKHKANEYYQNITNIIKAIRIFIRNSKIVKE